MRPLEGQTNSKIILRKGSGRGNFSLFLPDIFSQGNLLVPPKKIYSLLSELLYSISIDEVLVLHLPRSYITITNHQLLLCLEILCH